MIVSEMLAEKLLNKYISDIMEDFGNKEGGVRVTIVVHHHKSKSIMSNTNEDTISLSSVVSYLNKRIEEIEKFVTAFPK